MIYINKKIEQLSEYPFEKLRKLTGSSYKGEVIDLSIGQPYHSTPSFVKEIILKHKNNWKDYPPLNGIKELRKAYLNWLRRRFKVSMYFDDRHILPLSGTKEGLFSIAMALNINKVCIPNPFYQVYLGVTLFKNVKRVFFVSDKKNNYLIDLKKLKSNLQSGPALVYFCSPSNPQGKIADFSYLEELIKVIRRYKSILVIDECYIDLFYNQKPAGVIEVCEKLGKKLNNILIFHSLSKRSNVAGLRSGFVIGDELIINSYRKLRSYSAPTIPVPLQFASAKLWEDDKHVKENRKKYEKKISLSDKIFKKYKYYESPEAGFFLWLNVKNGEAFAKKLFSDYFIKVMPGKYLSAGELTNPGNDFVRIALVHSYNKTKIALEKIVKLIK